MLPEEVRTRTRLMRSCDIPATAALLAEALQDDAAYAYLLPDTNTRVQGLRAFFEGHLRTHLPHRCTHVSTDDDGSVTSTVTLRASDMPRPSVLTAIRNGLLPFALAHGWRAVKRLFWLKDAYDELEAELGNGSIYQHVHMMAVRANRQGQGLGSRLLSDRLKAELAGPRPFVLTTHLERNVVFYRRHGFEVTAERLMHPPGGTAYRVWSMSRAAT